VWQARDAAAVVAAWPHWAPGAPTTLTATLRLFAPADPGLPAHVTLAGTLLDGDLAPLLDDFVGRAGAEPARLTWASGSFREAKRVLAGHGGSGAEQPGVRYGRSEFFHRPFTADERSPPRPTTAATTSGCGGSTPRPTPTGHCPHDWRNDARPPDP
jgi:hypothetical protein